MNRTAVLLVGASLLGASLIGGFIGSSIAEDKARAKARLAEAVAEARPRTVTAATYASDLPPPECVSLAQQAYRGAGLTAANPRPGVDYLRASRGQESYLVWCLDSSILVVGAGPISEALNQAVDRVQATMREGRRRPVTQSRRDGDQRRSERDAAEQRSPPSRPGRDEDGRSPLSRSGRRDEDRSLPPLPPR